MSINPTGNQNNNPWERDLGAEGGAQGSIGGRKVSYDADDEFSSGSTESKTSSVASNISRSNSNRSFGSHSSSSSRKSSSPLRNLMHRVVNWFSGSSSSRSSSSESISSQEGLKTDVLVKGLKNISKEAENIKVNSKKLRELWETVEKETPLEYRLMGKRLLLETIGEKRKALAKKARGITRQGKRLKNIKSNVRNLLSDAVYEGNETGNWNKANIFFLFLLQAENSLEGPANLMNELNEIHDSLLAQIGEDMEKLKSKGLKEYSKGLVTLLKEGQKMLETERGKLVKANPHANYRLVGQYAGHSKFLLREIEKAYPSVSDNAMLVLVCDLFPPND
ncbi:hypothetical protein [Chlamydiifrater volucris]|uniref:hypothetical protein n=1 Tax=Chlamydiifrater volucris TaxID=2681470 RepID=UPI001BD0747A|nr:hypothetical protein [Chlamydiifrater volucris]